MRRKLNSTIVIVLGIFFLIAGPLVIHQSWAITYGLTMSPSRVNTSENVTITISVSGGTASSSYTFTIWVTKPGGVTVGQSNMLNVQVSTDASGNGQAAEKYPNNGVGPPWNTVSGSPANTDVVGVYGVSIDKTSPNPVQTGVQTGTFSVVKALNVRISSPTTVTLTRGQTVTISAYVYDNNSAPVTAATVTASTPKSNIPLLPTLPSGTYSSQYPIQVNDPTGPWNIFVSATWGANSGNSSWLASIAPADLVITNFATFNQYQQPSLDLSPGDTLYATFQITYLPSGAYLTSGTFKIQVQDPSGTLAQTLTAIYDTNRALFYTPSGFQVSSSYAGGTWELAVPAFAFNDTYGNSGPTTTFTYRFQVHQAQTPLAISPFYFILAALAVGGGLGATVFLKRFNSTSGSFDDLFKLTGGEIQAPSTLLVIGDPGSGSTTLALELLYRDLLKGKFCGLLSYDSFPSEVTRKMRDMGWDITTYLEKGQMRILDCYSALAGVENSLIRDPTDFTEVSIQVTHMIEKAKGPATILLDSVTPIFNAATARDCINFLQVIGAKVKNNGGMFIITATKGTVPEEARTKIESLADGVIELSLTRKAKSLVRSLVVKKLTGRRSSSVETEFEIAQGRGILIRRQRIPVGLFRS